LVLCQWRNDDWLVSRLANGGRLAGSDGRRRCDLLWSVMQLLESLGDWLGRESVIGLQPRDHAHRDAIAFGDRCQRFAGIAAPNGLWMKRGSALRF
jgi:hypothetical protein